MKARTEQAWKLTDSKGKIIETSRRKYTLMVIKKKLEKGYFFPLKIEEITLEDKIGGKYEKK